MEVVRGPFGLGGGLSGQLSCSGEAKWPEQVKTSVP